MQTDKFNTVHQLVECINDYWYEYISEGFNFLKKEIHFIEDNFSLKEIKEAVERISQFMNK